MSSGDKCKECGTAIPADSPGGFCAQCLLGLGLEAAEGTQNSEASSQKTEVGGPRLEARHFETVPPTEKAGDRIGRYRLLQEIGHGGCGVVYMAEQEEPVRRKVALKVIKLGMDTRQVVARFEAERQALALMDHSSIAKVLDAGATETGRPFFVMELVGGIKITNYCDQHQLTTRQRLDLFIQVCKAIQHAHQKGIIHRDIKPSNVLVAEQDGVPVPKVIDFGIAKATQGRLTDETLFTAFEQFLGTPAYMSPEQTQLGALDVDTRSDIYSLGVLLYELLTGMTPFDTKDLVAAGLDAMRRTILEKEPPTPSTRLKQGRLASSSAGSGKPALCTPHCEIDRDLDWIVMKCLEKDRARRYETANGLATDIERHLKNEPVVASPPSSLYRFQKAVRRNRTAFSAAAMVAIALVAGVLASSWQAWRATRAERRATREAAKSQQVSQFLKDMLEGVGPSKALGRDPIMLKEILDKTGERVDRDLTNQAEVQIELRATLAATYLELGQYRQVKVLAEENLRLARARFGEEHETVATALAQLSAALGELGEYAAAEAKGREALALRQKLLGDEHLLVAESLDTTANIIKLDSLYAEVRRLPEAEAMNRKALTIRRKILGQEHRDIATSLNNLATVLQDQNRLVEAEAAQREGLAMQEKLIGREHPDVATSLNNLASLLQQQGKVREAEIMHHEALALRRKLMGNDHPYVANSLQNLARVLIQMGKLPEAETSAREALAVQKKFLGNEHPDLIASFDVVAWVLLTQGRLAEAEAVEREALAIHRKTPGKADTTLCNLALILRQTGNLAEAEACLKEALVGLRKREPTQRVQGNLAQLADVLIAQEKFAEAEPVAREVLTVREKFGPNNWRTFNSRKLLGQALQGQQKYAEAEPLLRSAYDGIKERAAQDPTASRPRLKETIHQLLRLYEATQQQDLVSRWQSELTQWYREEIAQYREDAEGGNPAAQNAIAWVLATCEDSAIRNGLEAVAYAEKAVAVTKRQDSGFLDTLAAAYAEAGEFAKAIEVQNEAIALVQDESLKKDSTARLRLYESKTQYREH